MIPFFRKIRKKMADDNRPLKYMRYAIGEIMLVMVGILLALQVNNWNENRKLRQIEIKLLTEIKNDLEETLIEVKNDLKNHEFYLKASNSLRKILKSEKIESDSIGYYFNLSKGDLQLHPKTSGFNLLESKGMDIISNDSLRMKITNIYQLGIKRLIEIGKLNPYNDIEKDLLPYERRHFKQTDFVFETVPTLIQDSIKLYGYEPKSIEDLKNDHSFFIDLQNTILKRLNKIRTHKIAIQKIERVIYGVVQELEIIK